MIIVFPRLPVESPELGCTFDSTCCCLVDVDVCNVVFGVLFYREVDSRESNGLASKPPDPLEGEYCICVV